MRHTNELVRIALLSIFSVLVSFKSVAQEVPSSVDPGQLERELKGASEPIRIRPTTPEHGVSQPIADVPEGAEELSFILRSVTFQGDQSVFSEQDLLGKFSERIGQEITVAELFEAATIMSARYRNGGYLLSSVIVPAQEIDDGDVVLQVIEGYIDNVVIDSENVSDKYPGVVRRYLEHIVNERPLTQDTLERYLLLANDLPGISVSLFVQPSRTSQGAATLTAKLSPIKSEPWARLDNRGTKFAGPYQLEVGGVINAFKLGDSSLTGRFIMAPGEGRELHYGSLDYLQEQDAEGTAVQVGVNAMRAAGWCNAGRDRITSSCFVQSMDGWLPYCKERIARCLRYFSDKGPTRRVGKICDLGVC